jgi:hypothetical protein
MLCAPLCFLSCNQDIYNILSRTIDDPYTIKPNAISFKESNTVILSWPFDPAADEYILQRTLDRQDIKYVEIYRGNKNEYIDSGLPDQNMYLYRLAKKRGNKNFPFSEPVLGVSSLVTRDTYEENNTMETATHLEDITLIANMYYYRSYSGFELQDFDWYWFDIPSGWQVFIVVIDDKPNPGTDSHFRYYIHGRTEGIVFSSLPMIIENFEKTTYRCYFKLFPNVDQFVLNPTQIGGGVAPYQIKILKKEMIS